jgi:hypothetical protein
MPVKVIKYRCGFKCGKGAMSSLKDAEKHESGCWKNPVNQTCATCVNQIYDRDSDEVGNVWHYRSCKLKVMNDFIDLIHEKLETGTAAKHIKPLFHCPNWGLTEAHADTESYLKEVGDKIEKHYSERNKEVIPF